MLTNFILIAGGAGFIGSHMVLCLKRAGYTPVVIDNLSTGHRDAVDAECIVGDIADAEILEKIFSDRQFLAVMHFASFIQVGESVKDPAKYYLNNVSNSFPLLNAMRKHSVNKFIFSSTAAVYGEPRYTPIDEKHPLLPINPYGRSKYMMEQILEDYARAYDFHFMSLRYFNAAGRDPESQLHERHEPETHLIPLVLQVARGQKNAITVYGNDYETPDGTCIRDYIHVNDLCDAHLLALQQLEKNKTSQIYNLGTGKGFSVKEVIDMACKVTQKNIPVNIGSRRAGDPAVLVANAEKAMRELNWRPKFSALETIIKHAWQK